MLAVLVPFAATPGAAHRPARAAGTARTGTTRGTATPRDTLTRGATEPTGTSALAERPAAFARCSTSTGTLTEVTAEQPTTGATLAAARTATAGPATESRSSARKPPGCLRRTTAGVEHDAVRPG